MRPLLPLLLVLAVGSVGATPAPRPLREVLHPKTGQPVFRCLVPANWTSQVDAVGNLLLANPDHTANLSLTLLASANPTDSLDALARTLLASAVRPPWDRREADEISGWRGQAYTALVRHTNGVEVAAEIRLFATGDRQIGACSLLLNRQIKPADEATARLVFAAIRLVPAAGPSPNEAAPPRTD